MPLCIIQKRRQNTETELTHMTFHINTEPRRLQCTLFETHICNFYCPPSLNTSIHRYSGHPKVACLALCRRPGCRILEPGSRIQDLVSWSLGSASWIHDAGCGIEADGPRIIDPVSRILDVASRSQDPGFWICVQILDAISSIQDAGSFTHDPGFGIRHPGSISFQIRRPIRSEHNRTCTQSEKISLWKLFTRCGPPFPAAGKRAQCWSRCRTGKAATVCQQETQYNIE